MVRTRRQSVPPARQTAAKDRSSNATAMMPVVFASNQAQEQDPKLGAQAADALARMTMELNMRAISSQAQRLEQDLRVLVKSTEKDREFRAQNEARISEIWTELLAVRTHVNEVQGGQEDASVRYERCRQETTNTIDGFRKEIRDFKTLCDNLSSQLDSLPTMADLDLMATQPLADDTRQPHLMKMNKKPPEPQVHQGTQASATQSLRRHIQEVLSSTRRWNRDRKTTDKPEPTFIADYLKRQSRRNTRLAVHIQRAIRRRVRLRLADSKLHPTSLEEFCQVVQWSDVLEVVEELLVRNEEDTVRALS